MPNSTKSTLYFIELFEIKKKQNEKNTLYLNSTIQKIDL